MDFVQAKTNRMPAEHVILAQADKLMGAYGARAYDEARRRRFEAGSASAARYWLRVKAEIGRRLVLRRGRPGPQPASEAIVYVSANGVERPTLAGRPAADGAADQAPCGRGDVRRQAEAEMRAAMKAGDLDGVRRALSRLKPGSFALN